MILSGIINYDTLKEQISNFCSKLIKNAKYQFFHIFFLMKRHPLIDLTTMIIITLTSTDFYILVYLYFTVAE